CSFQDDMDKLGLTTGIAGKRIIVQGLGKVGYHAAKYFQEAGAKLVGLIEYNGAIYDENGLDVDQVQAHRQKTGGILNYPGAIDFSDSAEGLEQPCDVLIPAALESVIHKDNAGRIQAKIIGGAANGPLTSDG